MASIEINGKVKNLSIEDNLKQGQNKCLVHTMCKGNGYKWAIYEC